MKPPRIAFLPIARTTFDIELAKQVTNIAWSHLSQLPINLDGTIDLITDLESLQIFAQSISESPPDLLLIFQATFADSSMVMNLVEKVNAPILLWAIPEDHTGGRLRLNSLCGINLAGHALTRA